MNEQYRTEPDFRTVPYSTTSSTLEYLQRLGPQGRYASARNNPNQQPKKSMQKYFPAMPSREKNPSYSKIKPLQSRAATAVQPEGVRSMQFEPGMMKTMPLNEQRRGDKNSDRQSVSSHKHRSNMVINGKEMSTARLINRIHQNLQSLESLVDTLFSESPS